MPRSRASFQGRTPMRGGSRISSRVPTITTGTKIAVNLLANRWLLPCCDLASSTILIMRAMVVSVESRSTRTASALSPLRVPANTRCPGARSTGMLSPVIADWSMLELPSSIFPSTGIRELGLTLTRSPIASSSTGMACSPDSSILNAVLGVIEPSALIAFLARPIAKCSRACPREKRKKSSAPSGYLPIAAAPMPATSMRKWMSNLNLQMPLKASIRSSQPPVMYETP